MKWMGGQLRRHSKSSSTSVSRSQSRQHHPDLHGSSLSDSSMVNVAAAIQSSIGRDGNRQVSSQGPMSSSRDEIQHLDSLNSTPHGHMNTCPPKSTNLEEQKERLLGLSDWAGLAHVRPMQVSFPPRPTSSFAKRRKVTSIKERLGSRDGMEKSKAAIVPEDEEDHTMTGALPVENISSDQIRIEIGHDGGKSSPQHSKGYDRFATSQPSECSYISPLLNDTRSQDTSDIAMRIKAESKIATSSPLRLNLSGCSTRLDPIDMVGKHHHHHPNSCLELAATPSREAFFRTSAIPTSGIAQAPIVLGSSTTSGTQPSGQQADDMLLEDEFQSHFVHNEPRQVEVEENHRSNKHYCKQDQLWQEFVFGTSSPCSSLDLSQGGPTSSLIVHACSSPVQGHVQDI